jgi:hypothetical protein
MGLSSRCPPMELVTTRNISSTSLPSCIVKEAFASLVAIRKEMSLLFEFPDCKTATEKEARKKMLNFLKAALKGKKTIAVAEAQKEYELFYCFVVGKVQTQWDRIVNEMHTKNPWIRVNGKANKGICIHFWIFFMDCIELLKLTIFPADAAENSITTCSKQSRSFSKS